MSVDRVQAVEIALRNVQAQAAVLEELSEQLSLSVHMLETEIAALAEEARSAREQAKSMAAALAQDVPGTAAADEPGNAPAGPANGTIASGTVPAPPRSTDADGARLVALNMALAGELREAAERYLAEHYELPDRERLLDDVYAAVEA